MKVPSANRVAAAWVGRLAMSDRQGGIIQAPPALVEAVSQWVVSTVAVTALDATEKSQRDYLEQVKDRRSLPLASAIQRARNGLSDKLGVRALWALVDRNKDGTLGGLALSSTGILGYYMFGQGTFSAFSADFKAGSPRLRKQLEDLEGFLAGRDDDTQRQIKQNEEEVARLREFVFPGVLVAPLRSGNVTKEFDLAKYTKGWRYEPLVKDPAYLAKSQILQLRKKQRELQKALGAMKDRLQQKRKTLDAEKLQFFQEMLDNFTGPITEIDKRIEAVGQSGETSFSSIKVVLTLTQITRAKASWHPHERLVTIYYPRSASNWDLDDLRESVRHELQHMAQTLLQESLKVDTAGLPPLETLTPQYKQWMNNLEVVSGNAYRQTVVDDAMKDLDEQGLVNIDFGYGRTVKRKPSDFDFHALDDIEFFTRLQDSVNRFRQRLRRLNRETLNNALDLFSGKIEMPQMHDRDWHEQMKALGGYDEIRPFDLDPFFKELRRVPKAQKKYERAVKELRREFGYTGKKR